MSEDTSYSVGQSILYKAGDSESLPQVLRQALESVKIWGLEGLMGVHLFACHTATRYYYLRFYNTSLSSHDGNGSLVSTATNSRSVAVSCTNPQFAGELSPATDVFSFLNRGQFFREPQYEFEQEHREHRKAE